MKKKLTIVKVGGNVINNAEALENFLTDFAALEGNKILVHGGGKRATQLAGDLGIEAKMINGRRVTDEATIEIVTMVYAGLLNKNIVATLQSKNCNALGLSGADGNSIQAHKRVVVDVDYGFAGDVDGINAQNIATFINGKMTPVFCAITHDGKGQLLNTNADTIASTIAVGMSDLYDVSLVYTFEKNGVLTSVEDDDSVITDINSEKYAQLKADGIIADGMLPKMENCFNALQQGVSEVIIGNPTVIKNKKQLFTTLTM
ncbi:acetylglutamate kinase [Wenyingzhuangia aestuarii]|uniref:acetylglutamate kinase n=1 Tax=Wenyingzhuangia aestuarii TaxID=1647582 RepID=UPI0014394F96|nr:acetylglutamate kinase [Wenyingzhuangia aestuarii]NJB81528.1 acetylglutamate kinase [Wenyingzhuangia aestuarii]